MRGVKANPLTRTKIELGRQLYFDTRLSPDNIVSCASCHHSRQNFFHHPPVNVCETNVPRPVTISQSFVVESEEVKNRCVQVMNVDLAIDGTIAEFVSITINEAALDAPASHESRKTELTVSATISLRWIFSARKILVEGSAPEFTGTYNQCVVEQAAPTQILDQAGE